MTSAAIAHASATRNQTGAWVVNYTTTARGTVLWDRVAEENFHALLGIDLNGVVVSAPIIQPTQTSFTSFDGRGEISGGLDRAEAMDLAACSVATGVDASRPNTAVTPARTAPWGPGLIPAAPRYPGPWRLGKRGAGPPG